METNVSNTTAPQHDGKPLLPAVPSSEVYLEDCVKALKRFATTRCLGMVSLMYRFKKNLTKHKIINHYSQLPKYCVVAVISRPKL